MGDRSATEGYCPPDQEAHRTRSRFLSPGPCLRWRVYPTEVICRTREHPDIYVGSSPRGSQAMLKATRAYAAMRGRSFVVPDDIKHLAPHVLAHRLILKPEARIRGAKAHDVVRQILAQTPVRGRHPR